MDQALKKFGLTDDVVSHISKYIDIIIEYKDKIDLIGAKNRTDLIDNLIISSLISTQLIDRKKSHYIDIGTGSGILGIVLKLVNDSVKLSLCDKNSKKIAFLHEVIIKLNINYVTIFDNPLEKIQNNCLQDVDQLLIRGIKLVNIYGTLLEKFPRGTSLIYYGSQKEVDSVSVNVFNSLPMPGNESRQTPIHIFSLLL